MWVITTVCYVKAFSSGPPGAADSGGDPSRGAQSLGQLKVQASSCVAWTVG